MPLVVCTADQASKCLRHFCANDAIIKINTAIFEAAGAVQYVRTRPWYLFHDDKAQRMPRHIHAVAQSIRAQQAGVRIIPENVD